MSYKGPIPENWMKDYERHRKARDRCQEPSLFPDGYDPTKPRVLMTDFDLTNPDHVRVVWSSLPEPIKENLIMAGAIAPHEH